MVQRIRFKIEVVVASCEVAFGKFKITLHSVQKQQCGSLFEGIKPGNRKSYFLGEIAKTFWVFIYYSLSFLSSCVSLSVTARMMRMDF